MSQWDTRSILIGREEGKKKGRKDTKTGPLLQNYSKHYL